MPAYTLCQVRHPVFVRRAYRVRLYNDDGTLLLRRVQIIGTRGERLGYTSVSDPMLFCGNDGRTVRAEAIAWARQHGATRNITTP